MTAIGFVLLGIVLGLGLVGLMAGMTWAAIHDGRHDRSVSERVRIPVVAPVPAPA